MINEKIDYQAKLEKIIAQNKERGIRPSLLLHSCCAPCSTYVIEYLREHFDITLYYYNPNIMPEDEYKKRYEEQLMLCKKLGITHVETDYHGNDYLQAIKGFEDELEGGKRCEICFRLRLDKTGKLARAGEFNYFGTTLTVSPHKNVELINKIGKEIAVKYNLIYLPSDFKKNDGYKKSIELSKQYALYRQDYCGCEFSHCQKTTSQY